MARDREVAAVIEWTADIMAFPLSSGSPEIEHRTRARLSRPIKGITRAHNRMKRAYTPSRPNSDTYSFRSTDYVDEAPAR